MGQRVQKLWRNSNFIKLLSARTISNTGNGITGIALPLTAILALSANATQVSILIALDGIAVLVFGLVAGAWVDRLPHRSIMIFADIGRMLLIGSIPIAALLGALHITHLYIIASLVSILTVFFNAADASILPELILPQELIEGNSKLGASDAIAEIVGPALAGPLIQLLSAPLTMLIDALSFLCSALCLAGIRRTAPPVALSRQQKHRNIWHESYEGLLFIQRNPVLRVLVGSAALFNFTGMFIGTLYALYVVRVLHLTPVILGLLIATGGLSALLGAGLAEQVARRIGMGLSVSSALFLYGVTGLLTPLAYGPIIAIVVLLFTSQLLGDTFSSIYSITEISLRQALVPQHILGRVNASILFLTRSTLPVSALLAGILAQYIGIRFTILIGVLGVISSGLWLLLSPVRKVHTLDDLS